MVYFFRTLQSVFLVPNAQGSVTEQAKKIEVEQRTPKLEILEIERTDYESSQIGAEDALVKLKSVNRFLSSFKGLKELYIVYHHDLAFGDDGGDREAAGIRAHASTLEILCAGSSREIHCFDNPTLTQILHDCTNLKQLGLTLFSDHKTFDLHHDRKLEDLSGHSHLMSARDGTHRLRIIARHPNIQTLRILDNIRMFHHDDVSNYASYQVTAQQMARAANAWTKDWAQNIIQYLKKHGSNIRVLAVYRYRIWGGYYTGVEDLVIDNDGQLFPRYTYDVKVNYDHCPDLILQPGQPQRQLWYFPVPIR
ncbi:hypothetical protein Ptr902_04201 [Pyrenophora tritici-repentis]|nr:hypothetical protein Ptr902_04201 [Pyrenophora tritici-repentis]